MSSCISGTVAAQNLQATTGVGQTWSPASEPNSSPQDALYYAVCGIYQTTVAGETCMRTLRMKLNLNCIKLIFRSKLTNKIPSMVFQGSLV